MTGDSRRLPLSFTNQAGSYFSNHGLAGPAFSEPRLISPAWCIISIWTAAVGDLLARATWKNHGHSEAAGRHRVTDARIRGSTLESPSMLARRGETYRKVYTTLPVQAPSSLSSLRQGRKAAPRSANPRLHDTHRLSGQPLRSPSGESGGASSGYQLPDERRLVLQYKTEMLSIALQPGIEVIRGTLRRAVTQRICH